MPNVYTRTGDSGQTGLFGGSRVPKQSLEVEAYGTVDEANAAIGAARTVAAEPTRQTLHQIQERLFTLAAELASDAKGKEILDNKISQADIDHLEQIIDMCLEVTGPQRAFIIPGKDPASAALHQARTVTRRAERRILTMSEHVPVRPEVIKYVNRLSDTLYALARVAETLADRERIEKLVRRLVTEALAGQSGAGTDTPPSGELPCYDLAAAKLMAEAAEAKGQELGVPIVFVAVDAGGNPILLHRMADSLLGSIDVASGKAFTAAAFKLPTADLKEASTPDGPLYGIQQSNNGRVVVFGGGLPIFVNGLIAGGIGVSGGTVEEDVEIVNYALTAVQKERL